ncbi:O-methyltransferase [Panacibacter ginsenosidivorans]|uniref:O-methyltransferase n=1 Tax=Panacibacter ginsenosidivorans TaxID=1813871 RepID=A0A5B8V8U3_9BACT|nr:O-methyltransferase [Panacibacter ginsenosidivorans]QEC67762.1 O-methyltransferase [Panacibacter ginsenosidivorans]
MELVNILAEAYAEKYTSPEDAVLKQINEDTYANHTQPHMLSGHVQGKVLEFISCIMQPKYILEIGTFTGYSALCLAKGLQNDGELHAIELREEDAQLCAKNFSQSALHKKIHLHVGNALDIIPNLPYKWDLVFIDADKTGYIAYYEMLLSRLNDNGLIIADNVLFHGKVLEDNISGKSARAVDAFNRHVAEDERTEQVMLTVRDGLLFIKKKK